MIHIKKFIAQVQEINTGEITNVMCIATTKEFAKKALLAQYPKEKWICEEVKEELSIVRIAVEPYCTN